MVYNCINYIHRLFHPYICTLCGADSGLHMDLCQACLSDIHADHPLCNRCALPLALEDTHASCGKCLSHPPPFTATYSAFVYSNPVSQLIANLKFNNKIQLARTLAAAWLHQFEQHSMKRPQAIIPVPLHKTRQRQRGYNQTLEITKIIAKQLKLPVLSSQVIRTRATIAQTELSASRRRQNIKGAFEVCAAISYQHVAIFDDVVTTGSTAREMAYVLQKAGVEQIDVWCIARAEN